jgi:hypothetical protein
MTKWHYNWGCPTWEGQFSSILLPQHNLNPVW